MKLTVKIQGEKELLKKFDKFLDDGRKMVEDVTDIKAKQIVTEAKRLAPVGDSGDLQQNIIDNKLDAFNHKIIALMPYAAFQEFGTGALVEIPEEMRDIASQFKGSGKRKVNIPAQPFMYPAFVKARLTYQKDLEQGLEILTKRANG